MRTITDLTFEMLKDEVSLHPTKRDSLPKDDPLKEKLEDKVDDATLPTRKELHKCNDLLAILKEHCYFDVDWRTDIIF